MGDARNMLQSIIEIADHERSSKNKEDQKDYHFTIVDIKSPAIARDLVVLMLLGELSELARDAAKAKASKVLMCLVYTYLSAIMLSSLHEVLQDKIGKAKNAQRRTRCRNSSRYQTCTERTLYAISTTGNAKFSRNSPSLVCSLKLFERANSTLSSWICRRMEDRHRRLHLKNRLAL